VILIGVFGLAATAASGISPAEPSDIPDDAFRIVSLPSPAGAQTLERQALTPGPLATPDLRPFVVALPSIAPAERPQPSVPDPNPIVVVRPTPTPKPPPASEDDSGGGAGSQATSNSISGYASWYCRAGYSICTNNHPDTSDFDAYAAAGPALRQAIGSDWRGSIVYVDGIRVKLIDWCQCYKGESNEKLLDLYYDVFARTGSRVTVRW
jgi:hypothetical protein